MSISFHAFTQITVDNVDFQSMHDAVYIMKLLTAPNATTKHHMWQVLRSAHCVSADGIFRIGYPVLVINQLAFSHAGHTNRV